MRSPHRLTLPCLLGAALTACAGESETSTKGLQIAVAPLSLPTVSKVCYDILVTNGPDKTGDTVWSKGTPGLNGGVADSDAICSTQYGNLGGGGISYVGPCDADGQEDPSDAAGERTNSVTIWFDGIYDGGNAYVDPDGPQGWQNPCIDQDGDEVGCTLNVLCEENADAEVEFNFTILREANQGFFDIAVNFGDIFCSAKFDCSYAEDGVCSGPGGTCTTGVLADHHATTCDEDGDCVVQAPINLLHNAVGDRDRTFVLGFACTAGPGTDVETDLYLNDLEFDCDSDGDSAVFTPDFTLDVGGLVDGNQCVAGELGSCVAIDRRDGLDPDEYFYQLAVYKGDEQLSDALSASPLNKKYWNVAIGVKPAIAGCQIRTAGTAEDGADDGDGANDRMIEAGHSYPVIVWDVNGATCAQEDLSATPGGGYFANALHVPGMVRVRYTAPTTGGVGFANALSAVVPPNRQCHPTQNPCRDDFRCTNSGHCVDPTTGQPAPECLREVFDASPQVLRASDAPGETPASKPMWKVADNGLTVTQTLNSSATIYPTRIDATQGEVQFTMTVTDSADDDDWIGWAVDAKGDGGLGKADDPFMLFTWKQAQSYVPRTAGLRLYRIDGPVTDREMMREEFPPNMVETARATNLGDSGWVSGSSYLVRMIYTATRIRVWVTPEGGSERLEFNVTGSFPPAGTLGFFSQSQKNTAFTVVSVSGTMSAMVECGSADDIACAGGAPAVITNIQQVGSQTFFSYVLCGDRSPSDFSAAVPSCSIGSNYVWGSANSSDPSPLLRDTPTDFGSFTSCTISFYGAESITTPPYALTPTLCGSSGYVSLAPGVFTAGVPEGEVGRFANDVAPHQVTLTRAFQMQTAEVTEGQWRGLAGQMPQNYDDYPEMSCGDCCPVRAVSWWSALAYANALSVAEGLPPCYILDIQSCGGVWQKGTLNCGDAATPTVNATTLQDCVGYRLPTSAEWEYAARAGTATATYGGDLSATEGCVTLSGNGSIAPGTPLSDIARYQRGVGCEELAAPQSVAWLVPNSWGLFDMLGNAQEWVWDFGAFGGGYPADPTTDPLGPASGTTRQLRGGSSYAPPSFLRAGHRSLLTPGARASDGGLRLVRTTISP